MSVAGLGFGAGAAAANPARANKAIIWIIAAVVGVPRSVAEQLEEGFEDIISF